ncbi:MAG TPA: HEAT repeat domain-containing protein [Planctomycetes bacterium]|nr:HEAT repeat domain-containing protein [Planctomycetota bacterium]
MAEATRERRSSRARPPVKKGLPVWMWAGGGMLIAGAVVIAAIYPAYHRGAVVKAALSADAAERQWAYRQALPLGIRVLDPLLEAGGGCPPEAAGDLMGLLIKLTASGSDYAKSKVKKFAETWVGSESSEKRAAAARCLTVFFEEGHKTVLMKLVRDSEQQVRLAAVDGLSVPGVAASEIALAGLSDSDIQVRRRSAEVLRNVVVPDAARTLLNAARTSDDVGLKATILRALAKRELALLVGTAGFLSLLKDASPDVRKEAIVAISHTGDADATPTLITMLDDPVSEVRHEVIMTALYRRDQTIGLAAAKKLLTEPSSEVKTRILKAVGPLSLQAAKDDIIALAMKQDETVDVRKAALSAISSLNLMKPEERYPMVRLLLPAIEDPNPEVSQAAQDTAASLINDRRPADAAGWRKWIEDKSRIMEMLKEIEALLEEGNAAFGAGNQQNGDNAYFKAQEIYDRIIAICPEREKDMFMKRQQMLNMERYKRQKSAVVDVRGGE